MPSMVLDKSTITTQVVQELRRRILAGDFAAGEKLQQEQIAVELGVSRSPVREALGQLEAEGLVVLTPQKGAQVSPIHESEVKELFEFRALVEPHLLAVAMPRFRDQDFAAAAAIITEMGDIDVSGWSEANWRLHEVLCRPADRPAMLKLLQRTHEKIGRYVRMQILLPNGRAVANAEHRAIVEACRKRQTELAVALLRSHIVQAGLLIGEDRA